MDQNKHDVMAFGTSHKLEEDHLSQKIEDQCLRILEAVKNAQGKSIPSTIFQGLRERELENLTKTANTICELLL